MRLQLDYKLGVAERLAHEDFRSGSSLQRPAYFRQAIPSYVLCGLGLVASYNGQSVTLLAIFLLAAGVLTVDAWKKGLRWKSNLSAAVDKEPANSVQLVIDDRGIQETVEQQVVSFAPWSAVRSYVQLERIWAFNLAGGYTAIVSASAISEAGPAAEADLKTELVARSIPKLVNGRALPPALS